jgi:hypothetical protein
VAEELNRRQHPAPLSTLSVALALAALEDPPDVRPIVDERERLAEDAAHERRVGDRVLRIGGAVERRDEVE